jgi:excisionase family DNA binding protein
MERLPVARRKPKTKSKAKAAPLAPPLAVRPKEAARLLGVGHSHFYKLLKAGKIPSRMDGAARLIPYAGLVAYLDGLPLPSLATGPLLADDQQQAAIEQAREPGEPDFAALFVERLESLEILSPDLGGKERREQALAHVTRAYRRYHDCGLNPARKAVLALVTPKPPEPKRAAVDEPAGLDLAAEYEKRFKLVVPNVGPDEGRLRARVRGRRLPEPLSR